MNRHRESERRWSALSLALLLALSAFAFALKLAEGAVSIDFFNCWSIARSVCIHKEFARIYDRDVQRMIGRYWSSRVSEKNCQERMRLASEVNDRLYGGRADATGSPFMYSLVGLLSSGDYKKDLDRFSLLSSLCLYVSIALFAYLLDYSLCSALLSLVFFSLFYAPVLSDMRVGNFNRLQLFVLAVFVWCLFYRRFLLAGFVIAIGAMFKPTIAMVAFLCSLSLVAHGQFSAVVEFAVGLLLGVLSSLAITFSFFGNLAVVSQFIRSLPGTVACRYPIEHGNFGLPVLFFHYFGIHLSEVLAVVFTLLACSIVLAQRKILQASPVGDDSVSADYGLLCAFVCVGLGVCVVLFSSGLAWLHYYTLLVPLMMFLMRPGAFERWYLPVSALAPMLLLSSMLERSRSPVHYAFLVNLGLVVLFAGLCLDIFQCEEKNGPKRQDAPAGR